MPALAALIAVHEPGLSPHNTECVAREALAWGPRRAERERQAVEQWLDAEAAE
jgi:hypothetical protein